MKPRGIDLNDGHGAAGLEVHVDAIENHKTPHEGLFFNDSVLEGKEGKANHGIGRNHTDDPVNHGESTTTPIGQRPIHEERKAVNPGADTEDEVEGGHHVAAAQRKQSRIDVVARPVEQGVSRADDQPVDGSTMLVALPIKVGKLTRCILRRPGQTVEKDSNHGEQDEDWQEL